MSKARDLADGTFDSDLAVEAGNGATALLTLNNADGNGTLSKINLGYNADPDHGNITYTGNLIFTAGASEKARILSSGGITFNGDTAAANALDDYEEGSFTVTVKGYSANPSTTQTISGYYTKIGRQVTVYAENLVTINTTGASGFIYFEGLPFATSISGVGSIMCYNGATFSYDGGLVSLFTDNVIYVYENASNTYWRTVNHNPNSSVLFKISGTYFTTE